VPYSDVLVQLDTAEAESRYAAAIDLAGPGAVTGLYLQTSLINQYSSVEPLCYLPPTELDRLVHEHNEGQARAASLSGAALERAAAGAGARAAWRFVNGDSAEELVAEARCADIAVMPPPTPSPAYNVHASAVDVALGSGGPVLVAPRGRAWTGVGADVLVAWNGSREAARALRAALPLLHENARVHVRMAHPSGLEPVGDQAERLQRHLQRHGLRVNVAFAPAHEDASVAAWLAAEARATGSDMIVMGVYGHSRLREFVLGGVSRELLHEPPLPLLIAH